MDSVNYDQVNTKYMSRKFTLAAAIQVLSSALLVTKNITSSDWLECNKWTYCGYLAANTGPRLLDTVGDKAHLR